MVLLSWRADPFPYRPQLSNSDAGSTDQTTPHEQKGVGTYQFEKDHADQKPENQNAIGKAFGNVSQGSGKSSIPKIRPFRVAEAADLYV